MYYIVFCSVLESELFEFEDEESFKKKLKWCEKEHRLYSCFYTAFEGKLIKKEKRWVSE
ncbi:MAG: hypothetical protein ABFC34_08430 [Methanobacterium sp.]